MSRCRLLILHLKMPTFSNGRGFVLQWICHFFKKCHIWRKWWRIVVICSLANEDNPKHKGIFTVEMTARVSDEVFMIYCWQMPLSRCRCNCEAWTVPVIHYKVRFDVIFGSRECLCVYGACHLKASSLDPGLKGSPVLECTRVSYAQCKDERSGCSLSPLGNRS